MKEDKKYEHETKGWKKESGFHNPNNALLSLPDMREHTGNSLLSEQWCPRITRVNNYLR